MFPFQVLSYLTPLLFLFLLGGIELREKLLPVTNTELPNEDLSKAHSLQTLGANVSNTKPNERVEMNEDAESKPLLSQSEEPPAIKPTANSDDGSTWCMIFIKGRQGTVASPLRKIL